MSLADGIRHFLGTHYPKAHVMKQYPMSTPHDYRPVSRFDARQKWGRLIQPAFDQGLCASSWAVSTAGVFMFAALSCVEVEHSVEMNLSINCCLSCFCYAKSLLEVEGLQFSMIHKQLLELRGFSGKVIACQSVWWSTLVDAFCLLYSGVAADRWGIESRGKYSNALSVQQLVSCSSFIMSTNPCRGGRLEDAWWYLKKEGYDLKVILSCQMNGRFLYYICKFSMSYRIHIYLKILESSLRNLLHILYMVYIC